MPKILKIGDDGVIEQVTADGTVTEIARIEREEPNESSKVEFCRRNEGQNAATDFTDAETEDFFEADGTREPNPDSETADVPQFGRRDLTPFLGQGQTQASASDEKKELPKEYTAALESAFRMLSYQDNTEKVLRRKLSQKRYSAQAVDFAVQRVIKQGYLNEDRQIESRIRQLTQGKHFGPARVRAELFRLGFDKQTVSRAIENGALDEVDFVALCAELLRRRASYPPEKNVAFLLRYGYSYALIRQAQKTVDITDNL